MNDTIRTLKSEVQDVLENNILNFWLNKMVDKENGGFYGRIDGHGLLHAEAEKGAILNARILWAFRLPIEFHPRFLLPHIISKTTFGLLHAPRTTFLNTS